MKFRYLILVMCAAIGLSVALWGGTKTPISTDGSDPAKWDKKLDGPIAAPGNHKVIFENATVRVMSVTVPAGTEEPYHLHPYYSILVFDQIPGHIVDRDIKGNAIANQVVVTATKTFPLVVVQPPNALHSIKNPGPGDVHLIRLEDKTGIPQLLCFPAMGPVEPQCHLPPSTDGTDPAKWDPKKASAIAAPGNHKLLFENRNVRVISVSVPAGTTEPLHDHPFYSLLMIDSTSRPLDHDASGKAIVPNGGTRPSIPFAFLQPPQGLHAIEAPAGGPDVHLFRIEFKNGLQQQ